MSLPFDAIVLAGGRSSRLGGRDKAQLPLDGTPLVDRVIAAVRAHGGNRVVVVGDATVTTLADVTVRETPRYAGPAAAVGAGLAHVTAPDVLLLSCDLVQPDAVCAALADIGEGFDGVVLEEQGHRQWLAGRYRLAAVRASFAADSRPLADQSLRSLLLPLRLESVTVSAGVSADIDTPDDYAAAQAHQTKGDKGDRES